MTWEKMVEIEPRLLDLYTEAKSKRRVKGFCANRAWYLGIKGRLCQLVGITARNPRLAGCESYDLAYRKIYDALPNCRHRGGVC